MPAKQLSLFDSIEDVTFLDSPNTSASTHDDKYLYIEGNIPIDLPEGAFISLKRNQPLNIYSLGFQPAKSIPEIPRWFLKKYGKQPFTVLEPFAGSGTTIIESMQYGASVYWLDYNPLSRLICQVKTTPFDLFEVNREINKILSSINKVKNAPDTIHFKNKDFWFQKPVQEALEILREIIQQARIHIQPILWLAFSLTVRKTSDMNDGMILAAKRNHIAKIPNRYREDVWKYFKFFLEKTIEALSEWQPTFKKKNFFTYELPVKSAHNLDGDWMCDAVITSPPYINAIDYIWACKFELHWLGLVKNDHDRLNLYAQEIGTERIAKTEYQHLGKTGNHSLDQIIQDIYFGKKYQASCGQNHLRARVVYKYFIEMKDHFYKTFMHLKQGGYYCFTVGDISQICGVPIPVADLLTELAEEIGFKKNFCFHLLLKNRKLNLPRNVDWANTIKHDTVVVLQK